MEIYITRLCIGDRSTGTSDFIEAAGSADTDTNVSKRVYVFVFFFLFFSPASFERNSFAPIRKNSIIPRPREPRFFARHWQKTSLKKKEKKSEYFIRKRKFSELSNSFFESKKRSSES